jgi:hypothetical protein
MKRNIPECTCSYTAEQHGDKCPFLRYVTKRVTTKEKEIGLISKLFGNLRKSIQPKT